MKVWLIQANEPMPVVYPNQRLWRMGLFAEQLNKRNHDITWFATTFNHYSKKQMLNEDSVVEVDKNYRLNLIWAPAYKKNISLMRIVNHKYMAVKFRTIAKKLPKPDIVYVSFPTIDFAQEAIRYGKENNVKVIVDTRDLWPDIFKFSLPKAVSFVASPYIKHLENQTKKIMSSAYALTSISPGMLQWSLNKGKRPPNKYDQYFYMGYSMDDDEKEVLNISNLKENDFVIVYCGSLTRALNYEFIINLAIACKMDNHVKIVVCGDGGFYQELSDKICTNNLNNIFLTGWINKKQINYIMNKASMGLISYKNTIDFQMSVSNKFIEYLAFGLPMLLSTNGYMQELAEAENCGFAVNSASDAFTFIQKVRLNEKFYEKMRVNCLNLFERSFQAENVYRSLTEHFEKIVESEE